MARRRVPFDLDGLVRSSMSGRCFICEFVRGNPDFGHVPVFETSTAVAFLNRYPTLFGAVIVAPQDHREQVARDFCESEYLELQHLIFRVAEAMRRLLSPERIYILSLGSQAANSHGHWHVAPLRPGVPLAEQQFRALMHEGGVVEVAAAEMVEYASKLHQAIAAAP